MDSKWGEFVAFLLFVFCFSLGKAQVATPPQPLCDLAYNFTPNFVVCKNGQVIRLSMTKTVPPSLDPATNIQSKDVVYSSLINQSARIFLPLEATKNQSKKLSLIVYFHGGGFCIGSFANPPYQNMSIGFSAGSNAIVVSVDYRLAPENPLPTGFNDSWTAMQWVASHINGDGPEPWLNLYADFDKVFVMGDSAGATIALNMALRHGQQKLDCINIRGMILQMPFFVNLTANNETFYKIIYPTAVETDNLLLNPADDPNLSMLGVPNAVFILGEMDGFRGIQKQFFEKLVSSKWKGKAETIEIKGAKHMFNLDRKNATEAKKLMDQMNSIVVSWEVEK